ncbi:hypothetical protein [Chamaesiphon minutus]|nr:hypothetical protein [Chamaesiphon minutus]
MPIIRSSCFTCGIGREFSLPNVINIPRSSFKRGLKLKSSVTESMPIKA